MKKIPETFISEIVKYENELYCNINRCFDERSKWKNCLHSLINEMTLVYHYDDNGCDVSANGQKQTNKYARSITSLKHKTEIIKAHENKRNLAYGLIAFEFFDNLKPLEKCISMIIFKPFVFP